jgi:hypothetical protein
MTEIKPADKNESQAQPDDTILRFGLSVEHFQLITTFWLIFVLSAYCFTIYRERGDRIAAILHRLFY